MIVSGTDRVLWRLLAAVALLVMPLVSVRPQAAQASHTPAPTSVNLPGSLESEATGGACGDWDPACPASDFTPQGNLVYLFESAVIPAGSWEYKVAINRSWAENYGANFQQDGPNIGLNLSAARGVRFYYDHKTHYIADNVRNTIYTVPGSFNSEIGCSGDWQPECLRTFLSDVDGDGVFTFVSDQIPAGNYEFKIATNESWSNPNYGEGGGFNNIPFTVPAGGAVVTFRFNTATNVPNVTVTGFGPGLDNNIFWDGLRHDSRDPLYRTPGGAVSAGTPVIIRFRTYHNDVTGVSLRVYDVNADGQRFVPMTLAASDVSCYQDLPFTCDFWQATLTETSPNNLWYRFIVTDGSDTDYYDDNTAALDGGLGATTDEVEDHSFALMFYDPAFTAPDWARSAVIYQIFPDRFRNGRANNDARTGDPRYDDPVLRLPWNTLPEGYCRHYADGSTNCPWRFGDPPAWGVGRPETPRGRDYMGGDLRGVDQYLGYLQTLGVNTLYFNPIFDAGSNHSYDTQDYYRIDPYFGTQKDWENLVKHASRRGMRIVLDGVFNHLSSDSPFFDRYNRYASVGACESLSSPYRDWFHFEDVTPGTGACVDSQGRAKSANYRSWFGFDSIPEINKRNLAVQEYFLTGPNSVSRYWLKQGARGWRLDVMGDASFPPGYWETFRQVVKATDSDAIIISETWQKDSTLLRMVRGDRADTTMNYRLRDAVLGLLTPNPFDSKGFADSGRSLLPTEFVNRLASIREDYPDAAFYTLMNLLGSHDTERILWALTPGAETRADKEFNAANVAVGKRNVRLASLIQFTMPGAPTIYYGDEVGLTGDDDPDDRRTYPWADMGGQPDNSLLAHYRNLARYRQHFGSLIHGDLRFLLADDAAGTLAYGRKLGDEATLVAINRSDAARTIEIPVAGYLPEGTALFPWVCVGNDQLKNWVHVNNGRLRLTLEPRSGVLLATYQADLTPPAAPTDLAVTNEGSMQVGLSWSAVPGAAGYNVYRSPVTGGGYLKVGHVPGTTFTDAGLRNGQVQYYVVRALDAAGNESDNSNEVSALPNYPIGWANLQWPPSIVHTISIVNRTPNLYGQVWIDVLTSLPGPAPTLRAQAGFGPAGSNPAGNPDWTWVEAGFNVNVGNNDEFQASLLPETTGVFDYVYRYTTTNGRNWLYADLNGPIPAGNLPPNPGRLTVVSSGDTTPPAVPTGLNVVSASPAGIHLAWDAIVGDPSLYGYEVLRSEAVGGPYAQIARVTANSYTDTNVATGATYYYVVRAVDLSFNRSSNSAEVRATAELRTVTLIFNVTVPASTDGTGRSVYIAGFLDRLDGNLPQWNPGGVVLTRVNATTWTITLTGKETTQIEYKYTLGSWDFVEKGSACDEIANRQLTLSYGATGTQTVNDTVLNWRNVSPCGN